MRVLVIAAFASALVGCARTPPTGQALEAAPPDVRTIVLGGSPTEVAVAGDAVWVADARRGRLVAVDPATARPTGRPVRIDAPLDLAAGEGALWVTSGTGAVRRIDPSTRRAALVARVRDPGGVAAGLGSIWVTSRRDGTVTALDPRTGAIRGRPVRTGTVPGDVVVGFGAVWVADTQEGTVSKVDPRSRRPVGEPIQVAEAQILALAAGQGGVWVAATDSAQNASVELRRIEPGNGAVDEGRLACPPVCRWTWPPASGPCGPPTSAICCPEHRIAILPSSASPPTRARPPAAPSQSATSQLASPLVPARSGSRARATGRCGESSREQSTPVLATPGETAASGGDNKADH